MWKKFKRAIVVFDYAISWIIIIGILLIMVIVVMFVTCNIEFTLRNFYNVGGILSGVFAGLAFAGVIFSLYNQYRQSRKQQKNFERQLKITRKQFDLQTQSDEIKRFEDTFFKMVSLQSEIVNGLEFTYFSPEYNENITIKGRQVFKSIFTDFQLIFTNETERFKTYLAGDKASLVSSRNGIQEALDKEGLLVFRKIDYIGILDHYFRNLYRIIKFVHKQDDNLLDYTKKYNYIANNVRRNLSDYELIILFYNCLTEAGYEKFKPLIERYTLFKNIRQDYFTKNEDTNSPTTLFLNFPLNKFEEHLDIDNLIIYDEYKYGSTDKKTVKYKLQAIYKENEVKKWQKLYLDMRDNKLKRDDAWEKHFGQNKID